MTKSKKAIYIIGGVVLVVLLALAVYLFFGPEPSKVPETPAEDFEYYYEKDIGGVAIAKYLGEDTVVHIPDAIQDFPVVSVKGEAFKGNTTIETVLLPKHLETIGGEAFADCTALKSVTMEEGLQKILYAAFMGTGLETVTIPDSVTVMDYGVFMNCTSLTEVTFGDGITGIPGSTFQGCTALKKVTLPKHWETLESSSFMECSSLGEITIPGTVEKIPYACFGKASSLKNITLSEGLKEIFDYAFYGVAAESITIPASVEKIGDCAFDACASLKSVTFLGDAPNVDGLNVIDEPSKNTFGAPNKDLTIYYDPDTSGWDTTPLKDWYTLVAK